MQNLELFGAWLLTHSEAIRNLMLSLGVTGAGIGVWVAFRRSQTDRIRAGTDRLRQVTDSFEGAVTLLGHENRSVRLGAIYALERIARQNRDEHGPIMETLTAYVRDWSQRIRQEEREAAATPIDNLPGQKPETPAPEGGKSPAPADIQAVLTVLGRRGSSMSYPEKHGGAGSTPPGLSSAGAGPWPQKRGHSISPAPISLERSPIRPLAASSPTRCLSTPTSPAPTSTALISAVPTSLALISPTPTSPVLPRSTVR